ncbi:MAG: hypothetical protein ACLVBK_07790 [Oscillospiraceae bacterium]
MEETRKIGDYSVKYSMYIGHKDIALGENPNADKDERYMCCFVETNAIFERYSGVLVSDDFAEIAKVFGQRVADAAEEIIQENERACQEVGTNEELTTNSCKPISYEDSIENKVVVVKGSILRPEFRHANHQLMLCTGGFGAQAKCARAYLLLHFSVRREKDLLLSHGFSRCHGGKAPSRMGAEGLGESERDARAGKETD